MLILERKGLWFWGDRLCVPIIIGIVWLTYIKWLFHEYDFYTAVLAKQWIFLIVGTLLSVITAWLCFKYIPHVRSIMVNQKDIIVSFTNGRIRSFSKKDLERLGVKVIRRKIGWQSTRRTGYFMAFDKNGPQCIIPMGKGQFLHGKALSDHEAAELLAKELKLKEVALKRRRWRTWER